MASDWRPPGSMDTLDRNGHSETDTVSASLPPASHVASASHAASVSASPQQADAHHQQPHHHHHQHHISQDAHHRSMSTKHPLLRSQTIDVLTNSDVPSNTASSPIKRKPLSATASPSAVRYSNTSSSSTTSPPTFIDLPQPDQRFSRSYSIDSPTLYEYPSPPLLPDLRSLETKSGPVPSSSASSVTIPTVPSLSQNIPSEASATDPTSTYSDVDSEYDGLIADLTQDYVSDKTPVSIVDVRCADDNPASLTDEESVYSDVLESNNPSSPMFASKPTPPHLNLYLIATRNIKDDTQSPTSIDTGTPGSARPLAVTQLNKPLPKSPGPASPLAGLFNWGKAPASSSPAVTDFSSIPSPLSPARAGQVNDISRGTSNGFASSTTTANGAVGNHLDYCESYLSTPPPSSAPTAAHVDEMEEELKAISFELASSIRRELDLEDLVDRLQEQINNSQAPGKRSSDYFSDSGYSSAKLSESEQSHEVEKVQRRSEQEKASLRVELTNKLQDERIKRQGLDQQIKALAEKASQIDLAQINNVDAKDRVKDLEETCEDLRRRLSEERKSKNNFEDLLIALKGELQSTSNERDNLRDEVLPQFRARVEGLELEAAEYSNLTYESTKIQQELQSLKQENLRLQNNVTVPESPTFRSSLRMSGGLSRSNSVAAGTLRNQRGPPPSGISRSSSVRNGQAESREALAERLKDVEAQRDALHLALKSLLERQEFQNRENEKKIRNLESERNRLLVGPSKRGGFERDISKLRTEVNVLRQRAEDALEEKWQVEKGLGGLKMDLDRAEEEIASLRSLLQERDILIPPSMSRSSNHSDGPTQAVTSESLQRAYEELQAAYSSSLERIKKLESGIGHDVSDQKTQMALRRLERSLSLAVSERDSAMEHADDLKDQYTALMKLEQNNLEKERALGDELIESAERVEQLASQVRLQLNRNASLRQRLSETVARGDTDRKTNSNRIAGLQERLRSLEDQLILAQSSSEERVGDHEEELSTLYEANNEQLSRKSTDKSQYGANRGRKASALSKPGTSFPASLRIQAARRSFEEETEVKYLRLRVTELEKALADTENEMQDIVAKMSISQIEVLNLQEDREAAAKETRKLQKQLEQEQMQSFEERFRSLSGKF